MVSYRVTFTLTDYKQLHYKETTTFQDRTPNNLVKIHCFRVKYCFHPQANFYETTAWHPGSQQYPVTITQKTQILQLYYDNYFHDRINKQLAGDLSYFNSKL